MEYRASIQDEICTRQDGERVLIIRCHSNETTISRQPVADLFGNNNPSRDHANFFVQQFHGIQTDFGRQKCRASENQAIKSVDEFRFLRISTFHEVIFTPSWHIKSNRFEFTMVTPNIHRPIVLFPGEK